MARPLIIKEGPFVFLRNVLIMEVIAIGFIYAISLLGHYELIYRSYRFSAYLSFQGFLLVIVAVFQAFYLSLLFLDWYFSHIEIHEKEIIRKSGLLFRHKKRVSLKDVVSVEIYQSPLSRPIFHATIILEHQSGRVTKIKNIPRFEECAHYIQQLIPTGQRGIRTGDIEQILAQGEGPYIEFKQTLRYDVRIGSVSKELERAVMKTLVGFMNADGGTLIIGADDEGNVYGLENDYKTLPKKNRDGFENHLSMLAKTMIGLSFTKYLDVTFEKSGGLDLCVVIVKESHKPAYLVGADKKEEFFVRVGNSTQPFSMSEAEEYIRNHWK